MPEPKVFGLLLCFGDGFENDFTAKFFVTENMFKIIRSFVLEWAFLVAQLVKNPPAACETWVRSLGWEDPLEKGKASHSSILAWRIPWTSPWGHKELNTTEQPSVSLSLSNKISLYLSGKFKYIFPLTGFSRI